MADIIWKDGDYCRLPNQEAIDTPVKKLEVKPMMDQSTGLPSLNFAGAVQAPMPVDEFRRLAWQMLDMTNHIQTDMARQASRDITIPLTLKASRGR